MELFIAIGLNPKIADKLRSRLLQRLDGVPFERIEDLHITLRYLGETSDVNTIIERLSKVVYRPFALQFSNVDAFLNPKENVLWQGLDDPDRNLMQLRAVIDDALNGLESYQSQHDYIPHISLAFTEDPIPEEMLQTLTDAEPAEQFCIDQFELWRVLPTPCPNRFQKIATYRLSEDHNRRSVSLLCINDFHAALFENNGGLGAAKLTQAVRDYADTHENTVVLFGGDNCFGEPVSERYQGAPVMELMRHLGVTASVAGNHDFDFSIDVFRRWQQEGSFTMLAANLISRKTHALSTFVGPYRMITCGDLHIALIGAATVEPMDGPDRPKEWRDYELTDGAVAVKKWTDYLLEGNDPKGKPHAIIALTHFGLRQDRNGVVTGDEMKTLAETVPELDGAFAAHWHQFLGLNLDGLPVAEGGSTGRGFSVLRLNFDSDNHITSVLPLCYNLLDEREHIVPDPHMADQIAYWSQRAQDDMGETIAIAETDLLHRDPCTNAIPLTGTPLSALVTDIMRKRMHCQIAFLYAGRMGSGFRQGEISLYEFYQVFMFANTLVTTEMTGRQIRENIEIGMRTLAKDGASPLAVSGVDIRIDPEQPHGKRIVDIHLSDGSPLEDEQRYAVVLDDYLASDPLGFTFSVDTNLTYHEKTMRDIVLEAFREQVHLYGGQPEYIRTIQEEDNTRCKCDLMK